MPGRAGDVARQHRAVLDQQQRRPLNIPAPERNLGNDRSRPRPRHKPPRPAPQRGARRRQLDRTPGRRLSPRRRQVRHQDPPRHPVDRQVMDRQPAAGPPRSAPASNHTACSITPAAATAELRSGRDAAAIRAASPPSPKAPNLLRRRQSDAATEPTGPTQAASRRAQAPRPPQAEAAAPRDGPAAPAVPPADWPRRPRRHPQQHRLVEPIDRTALLGKPAHDRRRRQLPAAVVGWPGPRRSRRLATAPAAAASAATALMLEHRRGVTHSPASPRPAHQLDRHDAVAAQRKEVVVDARPARPPAPPQTARTAAASCGAPRSPVPRPDVSSGAGSARRSSLPFGVSGRRSSTTIAAAPCSPAAAG